MAVGASRFLFVGRGDGRLVGPSVDPSALARVELEGLPGTSVIGALVDRYGIGSRRFRAELETNIGELVLLPQGEGQGDVVGRRVVGRGRQGSGSPAGDVVGIVEVGEMVRRMAAVNAGGITDAAGGIRSGVAGRVAEALGATAAAHRGGRHGRAEGSVHEVGDAAARAALLVAGVGRGERERCPEEHGADGADHHDQLTHSLHYTRVKFPIARGRRVRSTRARRLTADGRLAGRELRPKLAGRSRALHEQSLQ